MLAAQNTVGTISVTSDVYDGYTLVSVNTKAYLINNCGQVINEWSSQYLPGVSVYLLPNGNLLRPGRLDDGSSNIGFGGQGGIVELFDWDGNLIWSYVDSSMQSRQHHDVFPMPNGNVLILSASVINQTDAIQAGRDPNQLVDGELYDERIYEVEPTGISGGNIVWEWSTMDHIVQDFDMTKDNFGDVSNSPGKIDINFLNGFPAQNNWLHFNAIQYDVELDQILISSRNFSEIWIIDHSTTTVEASGTDGDLLYRWGNPQAYRQGNESDRQLYGQHTPYYIPTGLPNERKIMLFNNGVGRSPSYSEVFIIDPPVDSNGNYSYTPGTSYLPLAPDFSFPEVPPTENSEFFSAIVSNGQQLPNGNILINEGRSAYFFELDTNNNIVWEYILPVSNADGSFYEQEGSPPVNSFAFRAIKYSTDYSAFTGRDLTPSNPLEINPNITDCLNILSTDDLEIQEFEIFPNPVVSRVNVSANSEILKLEVYSSLGQKVSESFNTSINFENQPSGLYFIKIYTDSGMATKKVIKK